MEESVVMTGGSFTSTTPTDDTITSQPSGLKTNGSEKKEVWRRSVAKAAFDDTLIERDWKAPLCKSGMLLVLSQVHASYPDGRSP
ncbi:hypothetical protein MAR_004190 [Mya arenaria]|uniref:Uncharacterized protein n=1 Tax=Mya arenaria TaxID=6604 RepID=A0ABY7EW61_MYAAR|nr:hypothetical protein MAR_004190 [Mya arenaria]